MFRTILQALLSRKHLPNFREKLKIILVLEHLKVLIFCTKRLGFWKAIRIFPSLYVHCCIAERIQPNKKKDSMDLNIYTTVPCVVST